MITCKPTKEMLEEWETIWTQYKDKLKPNRKSGTELLQYLQNKYVLTELKDKKAADCIVFNVTMNKPNFKKLPTDKKPMPKTFFLENAGEGERFYKPENKDHVDLWGGDITRIFVGIDLVTGYFIVEGSTMLWDELFAFQGLDEEDLQNCFIVAQYVNSLKRFGRIQ